MTDRVTYYKDVFIYMYIDADVLLTSVIRPTADDDDDETDEDGDTTGCTLFVKNLNFSTEEATLKQVTVMLSLKYFYYDL